jgi:hypothetical protein
MTEIGDIYGALSHRAVCGVRSVGLAGVSIPGLPFVLVIAGLIGLGGLALVMGMALSSLAELLALLRPDSCAGSYGGSRGGMSYQPESAGPTTAPCSVLVWPGGATAAGSRMDRMAERCG